MCLGEKRQTDRKCWVYLYKRTRAAIAINEKKTKKPVVALNRNKHTSKKRENGKKTHNAARNEAKVSCEKQENRGGATRRFRALTSRARKDWCFQP